MISASAIDSWRSCPRKKGWDWVDPLPFSQGKAAEYGGLVHDVAEQYHKSGAQPDESAPPFVFVQEDRDGQPETVTWLAPGKAFAAALPYLPRARVGVAEEPFDQTIEGIRYLGRVDLTCHTDDLSLDHGCPAIIDYKTKDTLSSRDMFEGAGDFLADPQAVLYAYKALLDTGFDRVFLRWVYIKRQGRPGAKAVDALLTLDEVCQAFYAIVHKDAGHMVRIRRHKKALDPLRLPWNSDTCMKYGARYPCPRIKQCALTAQQKLLGPNGGMMDDLLAELEAMTNDTPPSKAAVAAEPPKGVNPEPVKTVPAPAPSKGIPTDAEIGRVVRFLLGR